MYNQDGPVGEVLMHSRGALTLAGFRRIGIRVTWPEAVAIVLEASEQVKRGGGTLVTPDLEHISISPDGTLKILPGSPIPPHPVRQAARLLRELTQDSSVPAGLRELLAQNDQPAPACAWIEEFTTALAYFERPHRGQVIAGLAERAIALQATIALGHEPPLAGKVPDNGTQSSSIIAQLFRRLFRA